VSAPEVAPEVFTVDYVGQAGDRTFYLQGRGTDATLSYVVEKQQVAALAEKLRELLVLIDEEDTIRSAVPSRDPALAMESPVEAEWRVGTMGLAFEEDADRIVLFVHPAEEEGAEEPIEDDDSGVRFVLRRDQVRSFVLHAIAVVGEGRPLCQLCGLPMDAGGHVCPASNGHRVSE
jgi:uncharacterized repeat protein (TIGR03847 family)